MDRQALDTTRRALGPQHPETASLLINLGDLLMPERQYPEAEQMAREAIDIDRRALGPEHAFTLAAMNNMTLALAYEGKFSEAKPLARSTLEAYQHAMGSESSGHDAGFGYFGLLRVPRTSLSRGRETGQRAGGFRAPRSRA